MDDKKKNTLPLYIIFGGIIFVLVMLFCGNLAYYRMEDLIPAVSYSLEDMSRLKFHFSFEPVYLKYYLGGLVTVVLVFTAFWVNEEKYRHDAGGVEAGSAKWNKNIKGYNRKFTEPFGKPSSESQNNMILSQNISLSLDDRKTRRNNNVLVYGPAGTGKSRYLIKPNILQHNCCFLVCDPSGELFRDTYKELKDTGYQIKVFNLVNMRYSNYYNPFAYIRDDAGIGVLVDTLIDNTNQEENASKGDPFWEKSEKALLTACIYYLKDYCPESDHTFAMVLKLIRLAQLDENAKVTLESPLDKLFSGKAVIKDGEYFELKNRDEIERMGDKIKDSLAWKNYQTFKLAGVKTLKSILISAAVRLNPFNVPEVENLTSRDDLDLAEIGDEPTAIFAIIPQSNKTYNFLVSMMFAQLFETLYYKAEHSKTGRLNNHVRLLMDEFVNIGKIPEFPSKISTCRKYNISVTVILQDLPQIKTLYKDDYETIISNCDSTVVLGVNDQTTAKYLSEFQLGKGTIKARSVGHRKGKAGNNMNFQQTGRELMTQDETRVMDNDYCIVIVRGILPFYDKKYDLTRHPRYKETGDYDDRFKIEVTEAEEFYNFKSEVYDCESVKEEEPKEAEETLSKPQKIEKEGIGGGFDAQDLKGKVESISPMERKDMIAYLTQCRATADQCIAEAKKMKSEIFCCYVPISYSMGPAYTTQCFSDQGRNPVALFFNSVHNGYMEGYFIDPTGRVKDIFHNLACGKISAVKDYDSGDYQLYTVTDLKNGDFNTIRSCMQIGYVIDDKAGDKVEELIKEMGY